MLGVVIWSCKASGRAIVWCSDSKDLAYYEGRKLQRGPAPIIETGDLVEVEIATRGILRRATKLHLIEAGYMPDLVDSLNVRTAIAAA
jgi:hypothetical protein